MTDGTSTSSRVLITLLITAMCSSIGLAVGYFSGLIHFDLNTLIHLVTGIWMIGFSTFVFLNFYVSFQRHKADFEKHIKEKRRDDYLLVGIVVLVVIMGGGITAILFSSIPQLHLAGLLAIFFGFCMFDLNAISCFETSILEHSSNNTPTEELDKSEAHSVGCVQKMDIWFRSTDIITFIGLSVLWIILILSTMFTPLDFQLKMHDMVTGASFFHVALSQIGFLVSADDVTEIGHL